MANFFNNNILLKLKSKYSQGISSGSSTMNVAMQTLSKFSAYLQDKLPKQQAFADILSISDELFPDYIMERPLTDEDYVCVTSDLAVMARHDIVDLFMNVMDENNSYIITLSSGDCVELRYVGGEIGYVYNSEWFPLYTEQDDDVYLWMVVKTAKEGKLVSTWDLLSEYKQSICINEMLSDAAATIRGNAAISLSDLRAKLHEYANSSLSSVRKATNVILDAFGRAGFYGAVQAIISFVKSIATVQVGDDGLLEFSNNDGLIPKVYLVGGLAAVFSTLAQVAGLIVSALSKVVGALLYVAGGVINSVFGAAAYDYGENTKARLEGEANSVLTPFGLSQVERSISNWETGYGKAKLQNQVPFSISVPGGQVFVSSNDTKYRVEFHPDIVDRRGCLSDFIINGQHLADFSTGSGYYKVDYNFSSISGNEFSDFMECCTITNNDLLENEVSGIATDKSDADLRAIVACNIMLFMIYLESFYSGSLQNMATQIATQTGPYSIGGVPFSTSNFNSTGTQFEAISYVLYTGILNAQVQHTTGVTLQAPTWENLAIAVDFLATNNLEFGVGIHDKTIYHSLPIVSTLLNENYMTDDLIDLPYNLSYAIKIPKYDRGSFWATTIALSLAAAVVITVGVVATIGTLKAVRNKKGQNARNLEAAWESYKADPSAENLKSYQKLVKKNNLFNKVFGGTQYSREGLWASTDSSDSVTSKFYNSLLPLSQSEDSQDTSITQSTLLDAINDVKGVITGTFFTPDNV